MANSRHIAFGDIPVEKSSRPRQSATLPSTHNRRRSILNPGSFIMPRSKPLPKPEDEIEYERGIKLNLPLLKTKAEWKAMQEREENGEKAPVVKTKSKTKFKQDENVDASVYIQHILDDLVPKISEKSRDNLRRAKDFSINLMEILSQDAAMVMFFRQRQFRGEKLYNLCQTGPGTFDLRVYIRAFLFHEEFQVLTGLTAGIPQGKANYVLNQALTTQQRHTVKQTWSQILSNKDRLQAWMMTTLLNEALHYTFEHENLEIAAHTINKNGHTIVKLVGSSITIRIVASIPGQGLPKSLQLTHALPKHKPYNMYGKDLLAKISQELVIGQVYWFADASMDEFWTLSFQPLLKTLAKSTGTVPRLMSYENCKNLFYVFQSCNPSLECISPELLEHTLITIWKRPFQATQDIFEETIVLLLRKLSLSLRAGKCPHLFYPSLNIVEKDLTDTDAAALLLDKMARILWIRPDKISDYTVMKDDDTSSNSDELMKSY